MPKLKPEEVHQRRREIVEAARSCFIRSGFHKTTTDDICHEASITPGGLYHYFANKEDIIKAVVMDAAENAVQVLQSTAAESPDPRSALRSVGEFFLQSMYEPDFDNVARLDLETWSEALRRPELLRIIQQGRAATRRALVDVIQAAIDRGDYSEKADPVALANLFGAIFAGLRLSRLLTPGDVDAEAVLNALRLLIRGQLLAPGSRDPSDGLTAAEIARRT